MVRNYQNKRPKVDEQRLKEAAAAVLDNKLSIRDAAKNYKVNRSTLGRFIKSAGERGTVGGHLSMHPDSEIELAACLTTMAKWGFGLTREEVKVIVQMYVNANRNETSDIGDYLRRYNQFNDGKPGDDWLKNFLQRFHLSVKIPSTLEKSRKKASKDPEIIYGFYDTVKNEVRRLNLESRPDCIWNVDETSLYHDPSKTKVIGPTGQKLSRITATSGRESTTVMAAISAYGDLLPPLIVFKGKNLQSTWKGSAAYPGTLYAVQESGWMATAIFNSWFDSFTNTVKQRPLLLIYDGHASHLSPSLVKKAREEDISIIKLPPHTTDHLQPLDVCCFRPLKAKWDKAVAAYHHKNQAAHINKSKFVDIVGSVWEEVFTTVNIHSAFKKTGIYPFDPSVYPTALFDPKLFEVYNTVKPINQPTTSYSPRKEPPPAARSSSFEQILADSISPKTTPAGGPPKKRRRIDYHARVITDEDFGKAIQEKEKAKPSAAKKLDLDDDDPDQPEELHYSSDDEEAPVYKNIDKNIDRISQSYKDIQANIEKDEYYAVYYDKNFYIGRVLQVKKETVRFQFLHYKLEGRYDWPRRDDISEVNLQMVFMGPIQIEGTLPFDLRNYMAQISSEYKNFRAYITEQKK